MTPRLVLLSVLSALLGVAVLFLPVEADEPLLVPQTLKPRVQGVEREVRLWVAEDFELGVFADELPSARLLAESPSGELVLSQSTEGRVVKLADHDRDGRADEALPILTGLNRPHGLAFAGPVLFVAETDRVLRLDVWWDGASAREIIPLPGGGHHFTRSLAVGSDGKLYVSIGSSCDVCEESDPRRATVWRFNLDGSGGESFATGLRNAVGLAWEPGAERLWATENERNELSPDLPPDELNVLRLGGDYGWPGCYGQRVSTPPFGNPERCVLTEPPAIELPAHTAPLGLAFTTGHQFPPAYAKGIFVALHGQVRQTRPTGHTLAFVPIHDGQAQTAVEVVRGWRLGEDSWGQPVGPLIGHDGTLYLTDDTAGLIYRLRARPGVR